MRLNKIGIAILTMSVFLILGSISCTSVKPKPNLPNDSLKLYKNSQGLNIAIVPMETDPHIVCIAYDKGRGRAAAKSAGELGKKAAIGGLQLPFYMLFQCRDPLEGAIVLVALPVLVPACGLGGAIIGTSAGAIGGAVKGDYIEKPMVRTEELAIFAEKASSMTGFNLDLSASLAKAGQDLTANNYTVATQSNADEDFDATLKVGMASLIFRGELERDPDIGFEVVVSIEMLDASQNVRYANTYDYASGNFNLSKWNKQDGRPLQKQFERCYQLISKQIIEDLFIQKETSSADFLPK